MSDKPKRDVRDRYPDKYRTLLADDLWDYIADIESWYPPEAKTWSLDKQRAVFDDLCRAFFTGYPETIDVGDGSIGPAQDPHRHETNSVPFRFYVPKGTSLAEAEDHPPALILYFHGGGFVLGGLDSHDDVCADLCARNGFGVVAIDYRLGPEHPFPADFHDAMRGFGLAETLGIPTILVGDSAGACLAAAVSAATRDSEFKPLGQVLIYPTLSGTFDGASYTDHADAPLLRVKDMAAFLAARTGGNRDILTDPRCAPLSATGTSSLPKTVVFTAQCDPLCSDGQAYCDAVNAAGGDAHCHEEVGLVHGYMRARTKVPLAQEAFDRIVASVAALGVRSN
ncbi:MAG: alpha/beta hydrolase [Pseudomonadota bacterium]